MSRCELQYAHFESKKTHKKECFDGNRVTSCWYAQIRIVKQNRCLGISDNASMVNSKQFGSVADQPRPGARKKSPIVTKMHLNDMADKIRKKIRVPNHSRMYKMHG